jgi:hypothetical protein
MLIVDFMLHILPSFLFFYWYSGGGWSSTGSTRHCSHQWPIVPTQVIMMMEKLVEWLAGEPKYSEKTCPSAALSTTNPTCCPDANPGHHSGKPATNRLSYSAVTSFHLEMDYMRIYKCSTFHCSLWCSE